MSAFPIQPDPAKGAGRLVEAEVDDFVAQTQGRRLKAGDDSYQIRADVEFKKEQQQADNRDRQVRTDAELDVRHKKCDAGIEDQGRRLGAEMAALESDAKTTRDERYFYMGVAAVGVIAAIALAFLNAGQGGWEHQLSPGVGLLISGGAGFKLHSIKRKWESRKAGGREVQKGEWEMNFSSSNGRGQDA
jgi:hypothetical protein